MNNEVLTQWFLVSPVVLLLVVCVIGVLFFLYFRSSNDERKLQVLLKGHTQDYLSDVVIPDGLDGFLFADYLLQHHDTIIVINVMHKPGYVFGGEKIDEWTCVENNVTKKFKNPLANAKMFAHAITHALGYANVSSYVLFDSQSNFAKGIPEGVLQLDSFQAMLDRDATKTAGDEVKNVWSELVTLTHESRSQAELFS